MPNIKVVEASDETLGKRYFYIEGDVPLLFTENITNNQRIFGKPNSSKYVKDGINDYVVNNEKDSVNPEKNGTKVAPHYNVIVEGGKTKTVRMRLTNLTPEAVYENYEKYGLSLFGNHFEDIIRMRQREADEFMIILLQVR